MSGEVKVELKNGYIVSYDCYIATYHALENMFKEQPIAMAGLLEKCLEKSTERYRSTILTIQTFGLIDQNERIDPQC